MRMKLLAWSALALTPVAVWLGRVAGQTTAEPVYSNQRQQRITFNIPENRRGDLKELLLFASWDQGRNWQQVAAVPPDRDAFIFSAPNDGSYWLRSAAVTRQGKQEPENLYVGPPDQKLIIDTLKPLIKLRTLERQGEEVMVAWELQEENPDWTSFRVEYQEKGANALLWTPVSATAGLTGQTRFRPTTSAPINVRVKMRDLANNESYAQGDLAGAIVAAKQPAPMDMPGFTNKPNEPGLLQTGGTKDPELLIPPVIPGKDAPAKNLTPPPLHDIKKENNPNPPLLPGNASVPTPPENFKPIATTDNTQNIPPAIDPAKTILAQSTRKPLPPLQYVNNPEVVVEYELNRVGPSGLGSVELWWTQDDGKSWTWYGTDDKFEGAKPTSRHQRTIELPGDGVFGFYLVVKSRAGLGKSPPRPGDLPEMRVEVDTVPPIASLLPTAIDPSRPNSMVFSWLAKDANLTPNPITLEWSEKREGPWKTIAANLPNTGRYSWQLPDNAPVEAYIRLRVRDLAGNESVATTPSPQALDLSEPEGRLTTVTVTPRR